MSQILQFPKSHSKRVEQIRRKDQKTFLLTFSLFSLALMAVLSNNQMVQQQRPVYVVSDNLQGLQSLNRAIASAQPVNSWRDLEWEHNLAKRLQTETERLPASTSQKLSPLDQLRFGELAGKYHIVSSHSDPLTQGVSKIRYIDSIDVNDRPVQVSDRSRFLNDHKSLFAVNFASVEMQKKSGSTSEETWSLLSSQGQVIGVAKFKVDDSGLLKEVNIEKAGSLGRVSNE